MVSKGLSGQWIKCQRCSFELLCLCLSKALSDSGLPGLSVKEAGTAQCSKKSTCLVCDMGNTFLYCAALGSLREIFQVSEGWINVDKTMIHRVLIKLHCLWESESEKKTKTFCWFTQIVGYNKIKKGYFGSKRLTTLQVFAISDSSHDESLLKNENSPTKTATPLPTPKTRISQREELRIHLSVHTQDRQDKTADLFHCLGTKPPAPPYNLLRVVQIHNDVLWLSCCISAVWRHCKGRFSDMFTDVKTPVTCCSQSNLN